MVIFRSGVVAFGATPTYLIQVENVRLDVGIEVAKNYGGASIQPIFAGSLGQRRSRRSSRVRFRRRSTSSGLMAPSSTRSCFTSRKWRRSADMPQARRICLLP